MGTQKIVNFLDSFENELWRFATKKRYLIDSETKGSYSHENPIKFGTSSIESSLCNYSDAYVLVTENIAVVGVFDNTKVAFNNWVPFRKRRTKINETFLDEAEHINIAIPMYNFIEYSDNYSDTSGSLWPFKRDEIEGGIDGHHIPNSSSSCKYKSSLVTNRNGVKIAALLKYLSNFSRSLEMLLTNCKVELSLPCYPNCVLFNLVGTSILL